MNFFYITFSVSNFKRLRNHYVGFVDSRTTSEGVSTFV